MNEETAPLSIQTTCSDTAPSSDAVLSLSALRQRHVHVWVASCESGMLLGGSDDLPGLMLCGRSVAQLREEAPDAVAELLRTMGTPSSSVAVLPQPGLPSGFIRHDFVVVATFCGDS